MVDRDELIRHCELFVQHDHATAPLYAEFCRALIGHPSSVDVLLHARAGQARNVLLFASVHHLLLSGADHRLADFYPSLRPSGARPCAAAGPAFLDFLDVHHDEIVGLVSSRNTQTNEVARSSAWILALDSIGADAFGLVEVGASAGLNLIVDRYSHDFGGHVVGTGTPRLTPTMSGPFRAPSLPIVVHRGGLDLEPIDVTDDDATNWLRACVYADHVDRAARLEAAIATARSTPDRAVVVQADAVDGVGALVDALPSGCTPVVMHSWALTYMAKDRRLAFADSLRAAAARRGETVWWLSFEYPGVVDGVAARVPDGELDYSALGRSAVRPDGTIEHRELARCHHHGRSIQWL